MEVLLPPDVLSEVQLLVRQGAYPDEAAAVVELVRLGLGRRSPREPPYPPPPIEPPAPRYPGVPPDVNWAP